MLKLYTILSNCATFSLDNYKKQGTNLYPEIIFLQLRFSYSKKEGINLHPASNSYFTKKDN